MAESRDRLSRPEGLITYQRRRRRSIVRDDIGIIEDASEDRATTATPPPVQQTPVRMVSGRRGSTRRVGYVTPRAVRGRNMPVRVIGRQNISPGGRGRGSRVVRGRHSVLPSWYPRTPLRDITSIVRAIERRRARLRESDVDQLESSTIPPESTVLDPSESTSGAQLEHNDPTITPLPTTKSKYHPKIVGEVPKILLDVTHQNTPEGDSDSLTPQRKLLNSIDTVDKAVKEELHKLKRTPSARKEERDKKVRILKSMR